MTEVPGVADVVVVGAGIVGAACAYYLTRAGAWVTVLDAGPIAGGTSSSGEGNLLVSDKPPGPELELALHSARRWAEIAEGADAIEYERKGGLMVAASPAAAAQVAALAAGQRAAGVAVTEVAGGALAEYEPMLAAGLAGGAYYPQDAQVQPMRATAELLRGVEVRTGTGVRGIEADAAGRVTAVRVDGGGLVPAGAVVNATGLAAGELAATAGTRLPIEPRRGFILVTAPLPAGADADAPRRGPGRTGRDGSSGRDWSPPPLRGAPPIRRKVYAAAYVADVASDDAGLQSSAVIEGTRAGTVLIGSSRERWVRGGGWGVGADPAYPLPVLRRIAAQAVALFPFLARVRVLRAYRGFRPYTPDHLPVIGPDPQVAGLWHACGHEGAGIGLAPATGALIAALVTGADPEVDPAPFTPSRFA